MLSAHTGFRREEHASKSLFLFVLNLSVKVFLKCYAPVNVMHGIVLYTLSLVVEATTNAAMGAVLNKSFQTRFQSQSS